MSQNIKYTLDSLRKQRKGSNAEIVVANFQSAPDHYFGISRSGELVILFTTEDVRSEDFKVAEFPRYEHIHVQIDQPLTVENDSAEPVSHIFHVLRFKSEDEFIQVYFLQYMEGVVDKMGSAIAFNDLVPLLKDALSLFRLVSKPPRIELQGLWAELFILMISSRTEEMVDAWHVSNSDLWDFHTIDCILEVKSTLGRSRVHSFQNDQLLPPIEIKNSVVASLILARTEDGASIWDLIQEINRKVDSERSAKVRMLVHDLLGAGIAQSEEVKFNLGGAMENLKFFSMDMIPLIARNNIPTEISDVRFKIQLVGIPEFEGFSF